MTAADVATDAVGVRRPASALPAPRSCGMCAALELLRPELARVAVAVGVCDRRSSRS